MIKNSNEHIAIKVSVLTIIVNSFLSVFKLITGLVGKSSAMISDSVHSFSDVFSTLIVIIGVKFANKKSDKEHPYGHERMECVAAIVLSIILCITGIGIGISGINNIFSKKDELAIPGLIALIASIISIVVKEWMYWYTKNNAKKINSGALMADAWHHRSDSLSSIGSFIGILGARIGFPILDPIASLVICLFIVKASYDIFKDSINKMADTSCDDKTIEEIRNIVKNEEGVLGIDSLKTRLFGDKFYVDLEIQANGEDTLKNTHEIAHKVHDKLEEQIPNIKHCMIHVNPIDKD